MNHTSYSPTLKCKFFGNTREEAQRKHLQKLIAHVCVDYATNERAAKASKAGKRARYGR
jgi:hypothetical protein